MTAPEFRAALLALSSDCPICDGSGVPNHYVEHNSYQCRRAEREREAAAVEAMLVEVAYRIPGEDYSVVELEELRAAYLAARRGE